MPSLPAIRDVPTRLKHLELGDGFADAKGRGAGPGRIVWLCLWTYRRSGLVVYPGDPLLEAQSGLERRQIQTGLRFLESRDLLARGRRRRGRSAKPKRVIQLRPHVAPAWEGRFHLPKPLPELRAVCARDRARPHVDVAVMLGLYLVALEVGALHRSRDGYSSPFVITWACLARLLGLGRNTPRRSVDRLWALDLVHPTHAGGDWSSGLRVATPWRWLFLARELGLRSTGGGP